MNALLQWLRGFVAQPDKALHFIAGFAAGFMLASVVGVLWAQWAGLGLSWAKERWDKGRPDRHTFDGWDAFATQCGVVAGATLWDAIAPQWGVR